ncbi:hypothetical protein AVEN_36645-1 [Araneus ventricosus]|uniref:Uncharacterized protein n=1 Tax=Araneus ventricosus TaxID=182803 RepID=A0A4Y2G053_ARAVE|nr:hypothetical protein AVEN_36645-1 [Araneus ventricosus]
MNMFGHIVMNDEAVDGQVTYGLSRRSRRPKSLEEKIGIAVGGFKSIHSTRCGLGIQAIDATFIKSFQYFCCKNNILQDVCFSVA